MKVKNKNLFEFGVIIALLVFSLLLFGIYLIVDLFSEKKDYVIFLKPYTILDCKEWDCKNVSSELNKYNNKKYNIYFDGNSVGVRDLYYSSSDKKFYVFNNNNRNIYKDERMFAYSGNAKVNQISFEMENVLESELDMLSDNLGFTITSDEVFKVVLDFDNDKKDEMIYIINKEEPRTRVLAYSDNGKLKIIDQLKSKNDEDNFEVGFGYISNVMDIFLDGSLEFIYTITYFDEIGSCNVLYRLNRGKFVKINECEIVK